MIKPDEFQSWKDHPITKKYIQYLRDIRKVHEVQLVKITNSPLEHPNMLMGNFGGRIYLCDELININHTMINEFYDHPEEGEKNA